MQGLNRRRALKLGAVAGLAAVPALIAARAMSEAAGLPPPVPSPEPTRTSDERRDARAASAVVVFGRGEGASDFADVLSEILRVEGLLGCTQAILADDALEALRPDQTVLLAAGPLTDRQADALRAHVARGGGLIAMRPDAALIDVFGVRVEPGETNSGYLCAAAHPLAHGLPREPIQFHADAAGYRPIEAQAVAWQCDGFGRPTDHVAVSVNAFGRGRAALWAFDLGRSVVFMRQGNPAWVDQDRDGQEDIRACDMFVGWIDLDRIHIAQADEQQRLLVRVLADVGAGGPPLPRLWYFPGDAPSMLIATSDSHSNPPAAIERLLQAVEQHGGTMSVYYTPQRTSVARRAVRRAQGWLSERMGAARDASFVSSADAAEWRARGHELSLHPFVEDGLVRGWQQAWTDFTGLGLGVPTTARTHRVLWSGYVDTAVVQAGYRIVTNLDYYHVGPSFQRPDGSWAFGYFTGSGLPMRFSTASGALLPTYQLLTPLVDEQVLTLPWASNLAKMDVDRALATSRMLLGQACAGAYAALAMQCHADAIAIPGPWEADVMRWLQGTLGMCNELGMPIWSAAQFAEFTADRAGAQARHLRWDLDVGRLTFRLVAPGTLDAPLTLMLPLRHGALELSAVIIDGVRRVFATRQVGAVPYAAAAAAFGEHEVEAVYTAAA